LRLWLSLVVDEEDFQSIKPLPNLDYKIVPGNSLLGTEKNLINESELQQLSNLLKEYVIETVSSKKKSINKNIQELLFKASGNIGKFDFRIYFGDVFKLKNGFDIVIANPPYIGESGNKELFRETKKGLLRKYYLGKMDYFYFFIHLAINIGNPHAQIAFITTNYFLTAQGAKHLRNDIKVRTNVRQLINFNELKIFESAKGQHNIITVLSKKKSDGVSAKTCITKRTGVATYHNLWNIMGWKDDQTEYSDVPHDDLFEGKDDYIRITGTGKTDQQNSLGQSLLKKFTSGNFSFLGLACYINQGLVSGCDYVSGRNKEKLKTKDYGIMDGDGIFVFDLSNPRDLIAVSKFDINERRYLRNFYKNSDIEKYISSQTPNKLVLYLDKSVRSLLGLENIKKHLDSFKPILEDRREVATGRIEYFHLQWARSEYIFTQPKIVVPYRSKNNCFGYNEVEWFCRSDVYILTQRNTSIKLKYLLALLNSNLYYFWFYHKGKRKGEMLELFQTPLSETPIRLISNAEQIEFEKIVDRIILAKKDNQDSTILEDEINQLVYRLYNLTDEEIDLVERQLPS
jgi:adenine-specific DNA-methyltransferase